MSTTMRPKTAVAHQVAELFYWLSLLLLLVAVRVLIDPSGRKAGETFHIYFTLGAFEAYIWLLLLIGRWQVRSGLTAFAARSGIFAAVLTGGLFIALNELYMAVGSQAYVFCAVAVCLAVARLIVGTRWLGFSLPGPILAAACVWILALAYPAPLIGMLTANKEAQHVAGYLVCWVVAGVVALHILLVVWQARKGWLGSGGYLGKWWTPWILLGILAAMATLQLYATMRGLYVDWAQWYYSPIFLAAGAVAVALSQVTNKRHDAAWVVMGLAVIHTLVLWNVPAPKGLPIGWRSGLAVCVVHPVYSSGLFVSALWGVSALLLHRLWLYGLACLAPIVAGIVRLAHAALTLRHGKGVAMLGGAFALLGLGIALQWWQEHYGPEPQLEHYGDDAADSDESKSDRLPVPPDVAGQIEDWPEKSE